MTIAAICSRQLGLKPLLYFARKSTFEAVIPLSILPFCQDRTTEIHKLYLHSRLMHVNANILTFCENLLPSVVLIVKHYTVIVKIKSCKNLENSMFFDESVKCFSAIGCKIQGRELYRKIKPQTQCRQPQSLWRRRSPIEAAILAFGLEMNK